MVTQAYYIIYIHIRFKFTALDAILTLNHNAVFKQRTGPFCAVLDRFRDPLKILNFSRHRAFTACDISHISPPWFVSFSPLLRGSSSQLPES